jgi:hypothetical protein
MHVQGEVPSDTPKKTARRSGGIGTVYRERDGIVKRAKCSGCARIRGNGMRGQRLRLGSQPESAGQELAALAQPFLVDAVADAFRQVPFDRHVERGQRLRALE